jgi:hypothetical protein
MVIAALIASHFLPIAGPISEKSVYNRQALPLRYIQIFPQKIVVSAVLIKTLSFLTDNCCFSQGHNLGHLDGVSIG